MNEDAGTRAPNQIARFEETPVILWCRLSYTMFPLKVAIVEINRGETSEELTGLLAIGGRLDRTIDA